MAKVVAKAYLSHKGKIVKPEQEIELSEAQIKKLGDKVVVKEETEPSLESLKVDELKEVAEDEGVEGYSTMKKQELIDAIKAVRG